jgi:hypothetical protein
MALPRPDTGQTTFLQRVDVNGLDRFCYRSCYPNLYPGTQVELRAQPYNPGDSNAIEVRFDGAQIGWVPRAQNKDLARRLRNGQKLVAKALNVSLETLELNVYVERGAEPATVQAPQGLRVHLQEGESGGLARIRTYPPATQFPLSTTSTRTSVSVLDPETREQQLAWFRKSDVDGQHLPVWERTVVVRTSTGHYVLVPKTETFYAAPLAIPRDVQDSLAARINTNSIITTTKETTMKNLTANLIATNQSAATQAGYLEAGRIANNQIVRLSSKALPMMVRGYADTPVGKLVLANVAQLAASHLRAGDATLARLTNAMTVAAYQELIQTFDIEGWLNQVLEMPEIKRAVSKLGEAPAERPVHKE